MPWTHELAQNYTWLELLIEWYEDYWEDLQINDREKFRKEFSDGEIVFTDTGDDLIDKWEQELAKGIIPDLEEGLAKSVKDELKKERKLSKSDKGKFTQVNAIENQKLLRNKIKTSTPKHSNNEWTDHLLGT